MPAPAATSVTGATVVQTPTDPGASASYEVNFQTPSQLDNGVDTIIITFDNEIGVPNPLDRNNITISADSVTGGGAAGEEVPPEDVVVVLVDEANDKIEVTLLVPDMDTTDGSGGNGIAANANVSVVFLLAAGLTNPTEGGSDPVMIRTSQDTDDVTVTMTTPRIIELSENSGVGGITITATGRGFKNSTTTTFWRDADGDGVRDAGEFDLCGAVAGSDDVATCDIIANSPPFALGKGTDCTLPVLSDCNYINAVDGRANTATQETQADVDRSTFDLTELGVPGCTLEMVLAYDAGTLTADVTVGTLVPGAINVWGTAQNNIISLVSEAIPVTDPPIIQSLSQPVPAQGVVALLATITTADDGIICLATETVDTGDAP